MKTKYRIVRTDDLEKPFQVQYRDWLAGWQEIMGGSHCTYEDAVERLESQIRFDTRRRPKIQKILWP